MYILNPEKNLLDQWYKCNKYVANYLIKSCGIEHIHEDKDGNFYFVKTQDLIDKLNDMPVFIKLLKLL
jgi:hypothetical protein